MQRTSGELPQSAHNADRIRRARSWLERSEKSASDLKKAKSEEEKAGLHCEQFIFLWIAFNAAYGFELIGPPGHRRQKIRGMGEIRQFPEKDPGSGQGGLHPENSLGEDILGFHPHSSGEPVCISSVLELGPGFGGRELARPVPQPEASGPPGLGRRQRPPRPRGGFRSALCIAQPDLPRRGNVCHGMGPGTGPGRQPHHGVPCAGDCGHHGGRHREQPRFRNVGKGRLSAHNESPE